MIQNNIEAILVGNSKIPVVTFHDLNEVEGLLNRLIEQGVNCIEITLRTAVAIDAIKRCQVIAPTGFAVGVGTIINEEQVQICKGLNVDFMVSPGSPSDLIHLMEASGIPYLPGVMTPSEIIQASMNGCSYLKLFPFNLAGGIKALKTYSKVFPAINFCPTGGVNAVNYQELLDLDTVISVGGSWLI